MTTITKDNITDSLLATVHPNGNSEAAQVIRENGFPTTKHEEYKFTNITKRIESKIQSFQQAKPLGLTQQDVSKAMIKDLDADVVVFNNGQFSAELSSLGEGYAVTNVTNSEAPFSIKDLYDDSYLALNKASFEKGVFIQVPKNKVLDKPVLLLNLVKANDGQLITPKLWIDCAENTEAVFIEQTVSQDEQAYLLNGSVEIKTASNSHIHYYRVQNQNNEALEVNNLLTDIHRDSTFTSFVLSLEGDMIRNNVTLNLLDSGCEGNMYGLYLLGGKTHVDNHTNVDHTKPHSESNELYKGVLADTSRGVFNGKIFVREDAQKTNAFQQNNNILLSDEATINTKPQLEIWADDVKCSHGCTTGQLDEEALFYLQARGIDKKQGKALLLYAFAGDVLEHLKIEAFKEYCIDLVQKKLGTNF
ncbi:Fe-S cluster assembly protein SufD [Litoribacter ruber]|uniref:Fe-S cluster assembly protein SufD n=1 Tax=Litoribacter ruber TaxID=702568 RepID=UPI001BDA2A62|nr:Fe-S cluster assembly protein SufD [Litoribacter ruber]MBT0811665.1 Fe-S cluster assembly protein SufD [Litoribacter ruber]